MTGPEIVTFTQIVSNAYRVDEFSDLLLGLNRNFLDYVPGTVPFPQQVKELLAAANSKGWISELVLAIIEDRPNNPLIQNFLSRYPYCNQTPKPELTMPWLEIVQFGKAICTAYNSRELSNLILHLNRNFLEYVPENIPFPAQVTELLEAANRQGWILELVLAVVAERPKNPSIRNFLSEYSNWGSSEPLAWSKQ